MIKISMSKVFSEGAKDSNMKSSNVVKNGSVVKNSNKHMVTDCEVVENDG